MAAQRRIILREQFVQEHTPPLRQWTRWYLSPGLALQLHTLWKNAKGMNTALDISFPTPRTSISRWCVTLNNSLKFSEPAAVEWQYGCFLLYTICFVMGLPCPHTPHLSLSKRMWWYWHQNLLSTGSVEATWVSVWKLLTKMAELYHCFYL